MDAVLQLSGALLVCLALADIYLTILFARSGSGLLSPRLHRAVWGILRAASERIAGARTWLLPHSGPILLIVNLLFWCALLALGFALVVWPELGTGVQASGDRPTPRTFGAALYVAGYSLTTLGTGDLVPRTDLFRVLMVVMAGTGFSFLTLTLTYFMSIYTALVDRNRFALMLHHRSGDSGDAVVLLEPLVRGGSGSAIRDDLTRIESGLDGLFESHHFYPILHYFYFPEPHYAMSRILLTAMDTVTLIRSALNKDEFDSLIRSSAVDSLWRSGTFFLDNIGEVFLPPSERVQRVPAEEEVARWTERYRNALERLRSNGVAVRKDPEAGLQQYLELRREWNGAVQAFCRYMARDWSDIACDERL